MLNLESEYILSRFQETKLISDSVGKQVYLVIDTTTNRPYIQKVYTKDTNMDIYRQLQSLTVKNIPKIHYVIGKETHNYVIEELISGTRLDELIGNNGKLYVEQVVEWVLLLCDTLQQLHNANPPIIHRDIKPSNIIITDDKTPKLIDFSISRNFKNDGTTDTKLLGTEYYAAPEQFGFAQTDSRTDIYAIGKLMTVMLTGSERPVDESLYGCGKLKSVIIKCCSIDSKDRYQNILALKSGILKQNVKPVSSQLNIKTLSVVLFTVLSGFFMFKIFDSPKVTPASAGSSAENKQGKTAETTKPTTSPIVYDFNTPNSIINTTPKPVIEITPTPVVTITPTPVATITPTAKATITPTPVPTITPTSVVITMPEPVVTNSPEPVFKESVVEKSLEDVVPSSNPNGYIDTSNKTDVDDSFTVVSASPTNIPEPTEKPVRTKSSSINLVKHTSVKYYSQKLGMTNDEKSMVSWEGAIVYVTDISTGKSTEIPVETTTSQPFGVYYCMSRSNELVAIGASFNSGTIEVINVSSKNVIVCIPVYQISGMAFTNDEKRIVAFTSSNKVQIYDIATGTMIVEYDDGFGKRIGDIKSIAINPLENTIAIGYMENILIRNLSTWELIKTIDFNVSALVYSKDGKYLLASGGGPNEWGGVEVYYAQDNYRVKHQYKDMYACFRSQEVSSTADNKFILGRNRLYDLESDNMDLYDVLTDGKEHIYNYYGFSHNYKYIYDYDGNVFYTDNVLDNMIKY